MVHDATYDLQLTGGVATPDLILPNTATLTGFADQAGGVDRIGTAPAADASASSNVVTAAPTVVKTLAVTQQGDPAQLTVQATLADIAKPRSSAGKT